MPAALSLEQATRVDLAAAFRWAARLGMHESIANHFSAAVSEDGKRFLLNPMGAHFSRIRASDLLLLDASDPHETRGPHAPDPTAWYLHAELHQRLPQARCILHAPSPHATALCCLQDFEFQMLNQNVGRFHVRIAYDGDYSGVALESSEGGREAGLLDGGKSVLLLGNHGVILVAPSVAPTFDKFYYLEKATQLHVQALKNILDRLKPDYPH